MTPMPAVDALHSKAMPHLIAKLLQERQQVLVLFQRLVELKPYRQTEAVQPLLREFAQLLTDYMALGHFEVLPQLLEEAQRRQDRAAEALIQQLYPHITASTQAALQFNDRFDAELSAGALASLTEALSQLGEQLASRIDWEDQLICRAPMHA